LLIVGSFYVYIVTYWSWLSFSREAVLHLRLGTVHFVTLRDSYQVTQHLTNLLTDRSLNVTVARLFPILLPCLIGLRHHTLHRDDKLMKTS